MKPHLKLFVMASLSALTLSACKNPLGGDLKQSKFDDAHQPGLPSESNAPPTISTISAQSTNEDVAKAFAFTIEDVETVLTCGASVTMTSTNTTLVPNGNVVWSGTAPPCTGTVTPAANEYGTSNLTFTVTDGTTTSATTFTFTVNQLGDEPFDGTAAGDFWPFDALTTALYSFSSAVIQFTGGVAELIATVQTDSEATETSHGTLSAGMRSGVVIGTLTDGVTEGIKLGDGGGCNGATSNCSGGLSTASRAGVYTSRIMDAKSISSWTTLSWIPTLPFFKELPDATCVAPCVHNNPELNSTPGYTSLVGSGGTTATNNLMTGLVGLWHLNGAIGTAADGASVPNDSGTAAHGSIVDSHATNTIAYSGGLFNSAIQLDGVNDAVDISNAKDDILGLNTGTISAWVKLNNGVNEHTIFSGSDGGSDNTVGFRVGSAFNSNSSVSFTVYRSETTVLSFYVANDRYTYMDDRWHHIVLKIDGINNEIYVDGVSQPLTYEVGNSTTSEFTDIDSPSASLLGARNAGTLNRFLRGSLDEVAIWNRGLHANEIKQLYQRGASRIKFQVKSCYDDSCLYKDAMNTPASWQGPDGTSGTYFSELNNNSLPLTGLGDVQSTLPSMLFSSFTSPITDNQYFQYRAVLESDATTADLWPELKSTTVDPIHYPQYLSTDTSPGNTIIGVNGISFYELNAFTQSLGAGGCSNGVVYNLGLSNTGPWKYWTGAAWATADGSSSQANTAAALVASSNAALTAFASDVGRGSVFFKAFMASDGTSKCELDNILVGGQIARITALAWIENFAIK
jgi:hypothetical protein